FAMTAEAVLYTGGRIVTLEPARPVAEALATLGGRILAVGDAASCREALRDAGARDVTAVELAGRALLPGFIDTHLHPIALLYFDLHADLSAARDLAAVRD